MSKQPIYPNFLGANLHNINSGPYNPNANITRMTSSYASIFNPMNSLMARKSLK